MNKLIQKLAEQAMGTRKHVPPVWQFFDHELQEFADLILIDVISTVLRSDIGDRKQQRLITELVHKLSRTPEQP